jgi:hypothetical protein
MRRLPALILIALLLLAAGCGGKSDKHASVTDEANAANVVYNALQSIGAYYDNNGSYSGMTLPKLRSYVPEVRGIVVASAEKDYFCVEATSGETTAFMNGYSLTDVSIEIGSCSDQSDGQPTPAAGLLYSHDAISAYEFDHGGLARNDAPGSEDRRPGLVHEYLEQPRDRQRDEDRLLHPDDLGLRNDAHGPVREGRRGQLPLDG